MLQKQNKIVKIGSKISTIGEVGLVLIKLHFLFFNISYFNCKGVVTAQYPLQTPIFCNMQQLFVPKTKEMLATVIKPICSNK